MRSSERAQTGALAIVGYLVVLVGAAFVMMALESPIEQTNNLAKNQTTNQTALDGISYTYSMVSNLEFIIVLISAFGLIVLAFYERRGGI